VCIIDNSEFWKNLARELEDPEFKKAFFKESLSTVWFDKNESF
jgi:hypothetical protein